MLLKNGCEISLIVSFLCLENSSNGWSFSSHFGPGVTLKMEDVYRQRKNQVERTSVSDIMEGLNNPRQKTSNLLWKIVQKNSNVTKIKIYSSTVYQKESFM